MNKNIQPIGNVGNQQAPSQPAVQQPQSTYSSEPAMNTNAGVEGLINVSVILDKESLKIIQEASSVHAESIVNLGIKLFAKTNIYKEFMLKQDFQQLEQSTEDLQSLTDITATPSTSPVPTTAQKAQTTTTSVSGQSSGFASW